MYLTELLFLDHSLAPKSFQNIGDGVTARGVYLGSISEAFYAFRAFEFCQVQANWNGIDFEIEAGEPLGGA